MGGGTLIIKGETGIGRGSKISIDKKAVLSLGENFSIIGRSGKHEKRRILSL